MSRKLSHRSSSVSLRNLFCTGVFKRLCRALGLSLVALGLVLQQPQSVWAFDQLELELGSLSGAGWQAEQLRFLLDWRDANTTYSVQIGKLQLPALARTLTGVRIECHQGAIETRRIACGRGKLILPDPLLSDDEVALSFELDRVSGRLTGRLKKIALAAGALDLQFQIDAEGWRTEFQGRGLSLSALLAHRPQLQVLVADWSLAGSMDLSGRFSGSGAQLHTARWQGRLTGLSLADAASLYAGEGVGIGYRGQLVSGPGGWRIDTTLDFNQGELLTPVCYLDAHAHPLTLKASLDLDSDLETVDVRDLTLELPDLLALNLQGRLRKGDRPLVEWLKLRLDPVPAGDLYREMLQPVLAGSPWGRFEMAGETELDLELRDGAVLLSLGLREFAIDDESSNGLAKRLGLDGLNGRLHWSSEGAVEASRLSWRGGHLLQQIPIGPGEIEFAAAGSGLELTRQARLPLLDGALVVDRFGLQALGSESQRLTFDGYLEPISMASLSQALGWLPLSGKLSGMLPGLKYEQGLLSVDGVLLVRIFDGDILIKQLQSQDLFGVYPQLSANIELRNLELESLTRTFSFGRITGRLDGYVRDLRLEAWSPVSFDARFYTPQGDRSPRRISQQAVDNIANLGGAGMSGAMARSFMRLFEEFSYKRIGIGCRLHKGVCDMVGAGPAPQGYYLVQGGGIPRIDIIGYNTTADWGSLVLRLKQIATAGEAKVE
jgi:hypothetical protein